MSSDERRMLGASDLRAALCCSSRSSSCPREWRTRASPVFSHPGGVTMKIGIIGSGSVAQMLGRKLAEGGHTVTVSSRDTTKAKQSPLGPLPSPEDWAAEVRGPRSRGGRRQLRRRGRVRRARLQLHERRRLARSAAGGGRGEPARQDPRRHLEPARLLEGDAADADRLQHRLARRADPARLPESAGREDAEHGQGVR